MNHISKNSLLVQGIKKAGGTIYRLIHGHPKWIDFPVSIQFDTHNYCQLECIYCNPQGSFQINQGTMSLETIKTVLKYFSGYDVDVVSPWMNGDSLLETRMPTITEMINKYIPSARVDVFTNGVAYNSKHLLIDENIDVIRFTISAVSEEMYTRIHGKPFLNQVLKTLDWITYNKLAHQKIILNFIPTGYNLCELEEWKKVFAKYEQDIRPIHEGVDQRMSTSAKEGLKFEDALKLSQNPQIRQLKFYGKPCVCWHNLSISWEGKIMQCPIVPYQFNYGKVGEIDILDVWKKRLEIGLDATCCKECNIKAPNWREILDKYRK